jgi:uncharacterized protein GlcG (DUF336 family)
MLKHTLFLCAATAALLTLSGAHAQAPPVGAPAAPAPVPEAMPWNIPYGTPIGVDHAKQVAAAAIAEAKKHGWKLALAIVEPTGDLVYFEKMDDTQYASIAIAQAKARAAATFRRPTQVFEEGINGGTPSTGTLPGVIGSRGGFPLIENGKLIGAIGMSGALAAQDAVASKAGADTVK